MIQLGCFSVCELIELATAPEDGVYEIVIKFLNNTVYITQDLLTGDAIELLLSESLFNEHTTYIVTVTSPSLTVTQYAFKTQITYVI